MSSFGNSSRRIRRDSLRVTSLERPGWVTAERHAPAVGAEVFTTEGVAHVVRVLGKTGDGSRLLELSLVDRPRPPFFAAASNVLVPAPQSAPASA
jgi:hypothetical protein